MKLAQILTRISLEKPKTITVIMTLMTLLLGLFIIKVEVDTDPENMLREDEEVRIFHNQTKLDFGLYDVVVLGIVNNAHSDGVFNPTTLKRVHDLTEFSKNLHHPKHPEYKVVKDDIIAPGNVDAIEQAGKSQVKIDWLMKEPPADRKQAMQIKDKIMTNPLLRGTLVSEDYKAVGIYLPITSKEFANNLRNQLLEKIKTLPAGDEEYYITGLPVAEDTFGVEMFVQMAICAPLAMGMIFLLLLLFFKKLRLIISPMIIAMATVISTMGLLIGTGNTLHIMTSMIPIFLMPIAVVDSIHILSEFFDNYQKTRDREKTLEEVMSHLFTPMLYTSLTSSAGFASLAFTPIPPVQIFGIFVAVGIMLAWFLTIIFIPSYIMMLSEENLAGLGAGAGGTDDNIDNTIMSQLLKAAGIFTWQNTKLILALTLLAIGIAGYGISKIQINDNPVRWFEEDHDIRVADKVLNQHFGGTYEAYLILNSNTSKLDLQGNIEAVKNELNTRLAPVLENQPDLFTSIESEVEKAAKNSDSSNVFFEKLIKSWEEKQEESSDDDFNAWSDALDIPEAVENYDKIFKKPEMLKYISKLQEHLLKSGEVGKSNSISDVVKKIHMELFEANEKHFTIPASEDGVAQCLISFQNSNKPDDLWHLVTPDYKKANLWVQLNSGDNKDMEKVVKEVEDYLKNNPPPAAIEYKWAGLTYLNIVWQDKMVNGMAKSFIWSFIIVFMMMVILFRSVLWGALAMIPLSVTIALIYGVIGLIGKDYDMPVAVLSSLTLGLAVDFAIHFLERTRMTFKRLGSWKAAAEEMFKEPARAITRNIIVIAIGFLPLLMAPLVPYQTVGIFLASIMAISGIATIFILPAMISTLQTWLFKRG
jgi:uncharacterized protein